MAEIIAQGAVTRHIQETIYSDRKHVFRCNTLSNPLYYFRNGVFAPVDVTDLKDSTSTIGDIALRDKGIITVGVAKKDTAEKYLGLRPDGIQEGSEQLEFSLLKVELDAKSQTINFKGKVPVGSTGYQAGSMLIKSTRNRTTQLYPVTSPIESFKLSFVLHLKGMKIIYQKEYDEYWVYSNSGPFRFKIVKPKLVTLDEAGEMVVIDGDYVQHSMTDNGDGTYTYVKEATKTFENKPVTGSYYIDVDTIYSTTADGYVLKNLAALDWGTVHDATSGSSTSNSSQSYTVRITYNDTDPVTQINRAFYYFDTTAVSGTMTAVTLNIYGFSAGTCVVSAMKGTQADTLTTADFDAFTGNEYGHSGVWSTTDYNVIAFNAQGVLDCHQPTTKIAVRDYTYDYLDATPPNPTAVSSGLYFSDAAGTTVDPYLSITSNGWTPRTVVVG